MQTIQTRELLLGARHLLRESAQACSLVNAGHARAMAQIARAWQLAEEAQRFLQQVRQWRDPWSANPFQADGSGAGFVSSESAQ